MTHLQFFISTVSTRVACYQVRAANSTVSFIHFLGHLQCVYCQQQSFRMVSLVDELSGEHHFF
jgi:hypothetical protein